MTLWQALVLGGIVLLVVGAYLVTPKVSRRRRK
jgi:hypothetical protein